MEEELENIKQAIIYLAECLETGSWVGSVSDVEDILYCTPVLEIKQGGTLKANMDARIEPVSEKEGFIDHGADDFGGFESR